MTEKEINLEILDQLYSIALGVWSLMEKNISGSFTAREVHNLLGKKIKMGDNDLLQKHEISVGAFHCEFTARAVFFLVAKFESLAGVGNKKRLFVAEEKGEEEGSVTFIVAKDMRELCQFADSKNEQPAYHYIFIDTVRKCLVATDGHKMMVQPINILDMSGDTTEMRINAKDFDKMCRKMKNKMVYRMTARKERVYSDSVTKVEFDGVLSSVGSDYRYSDWASVWHKRSNRLCLGILDWTDVCSFAKGCGKDMIEFRGSHGEDFLTMEAGGNSRKVQLRSKIEYSFRVFMGTSSIMALQKDCSVDLYLGTIANEPILTAVDGQIFLFMPGYSKEAFVGGHVGENLVTPVVTEDVDLLQLYAPAVEDRTTDYTESTEKKSTDGTERTDKKAIIKKATAKKTTAKKTERRVDDSRKFSFEVVGVKPGDKLTFMDGTEVVAVDGTKVAYMGEEYTLSGFCKKFMPEEKRNKANSYRGCAFFYRDGVKLEKLFKEALKAAEAVTTEPVADNVDDVEVVEMATTEVPTTDNTEKTEMKNVLVAPDVVVKSSDWTDGTDDVRSSNETNRTDCLRHLCHLMMILTNGMDGTKCLARVACSSLMRAVVHTMPLPPPRAKKRNVYG